MKICPKCGEEHFKNGRFCSRKCANSRKFNKNACVKKSKANKAYWDNLSDVEKHKVIKRLEIANKIKQGINVMDLMERDFSVLSYQSKRKRVIIEQDGKCNKCSAFEWLGELLTLELEHKDGNKKNNERKNLEALCPNCHSLTKTWRGRSNKISKVERMHRDLRIYKQMLG